MATTPKIDATKFESMIQRRGRDVLWSEAVICSCWNLDTQQPNYNCNACQGFGYIHTNPTQARALVTSITQNKDFDETAGVFEIGDAVMTVPKQLPAVVNGFFNYHSMIDQPLFEIGMWDKVTLLDDEYKSSELLQKGVSLFGRPADTLIQDVPTRIKSVQTVDPNTGAVTTYQPTTDYKLSGQLVQWQVGGNAPTDGATYSVVYFHRPVYTVTAVLPKPRHQDGQDLPRYVALRYKNGGLDRK